MPGENLKSKAKLSKRYSFMAEHRGGPLSKDHHRYLNKWARKCAQHILLRLDIKNIDHRLMEALQVSKEWESNQASTGQAMKASLNAHALARETADPVLKAIARSVGQAVATAHMADHSLEGAFYALKAVRAANKNVEKEREWQEKQLAKLPKELIKIVHTMWRKKELDKRI